MRRPVAVLIAVGLIAAAIVVRTRIDSGSGGTGSARGKLKLVCAPELAAACKALGSEVDVDVQDPGPVADDLEKASDGGGLDGWLTPGPWGEIVESARKAAGTSPLLAIEHSPAHTRIGLAVWPDRLKVLTTACSGPPTWKCVGASAGKQWAAIGGPAAWGTVTMAFPDPPNDATGLAALGAASAGYFGTTDFSSTDLEDPGFQTWLRNLAQANADNPSLDDVLTRGPADAAAAAILEAVGGPVLALSPRSPKPSLTYPAPVASVDVELGSAISARGQRLAQLVRDRLPELLRKAGWEAGGASGLPAPDLLDALRQAWRDAS